METSGAVLLGSKVGETIRKGIVDPAHYTGDSNSTNATTDSSTGNNSGMIYFTESRLDDTTLLLYGQLSAMLGAAAWQIIATLCKMPVSGTHSIVGAIVGFHVAVKGWTGIGWMKLLKIGKFCEKKFFESKPGFCRSGDRSRPKFFLLKWFIFSCIVVFIASFGWNCIGFALLVFACKSCNSNSIV